MGEIPNILQLAAPKLLVGAGFQITLFVWRFWLISFPVSTCNHFHLQPIRHLYLIVFKPMPCGGDV